MIRLSQAPHSKHECDKSIALWELPYLLLIMEEVVILGQTRHLTFRGTKLGELKAT